MEPRSGIGHTFEGWSATLRNSETRASRHSWKIPPPNCCRPESLRAQHHPTSLCSGNCPRRSKQHRRDCKTKRRRNHPGQKCTQRCPGLIEPTIAGNRTGQCPSTTCTNDLTTERSCSAIQRINGSRARSNCSSKGISNHCRTDIVAGSVAWDFTRILANPSRFTGSSNDLADTLRRRLQVSRRVPTGYCSCTHPCGTTNQRNADLFQHPSGRTVPNHKHRRRLLGMQRRRLSWMRRHDDRRSRLCWMSIMWFRRLLR